MSLVVVDASVLVSFYVADDPRRGQITQRLGAGNALFAPAHIDAEVASALRSIARSNPVVEQAAPEALKHLAGFPIRRMAIAPLLDRIWELRHTITPYDAAYVALAERLNGPLLTCDGKVATASGARCAYDVIA